MTTLRSINANRPLRGGTAFVRVAASMYGSNVAGSAASPCAQHEDGRHEGQALHHPGEERV